MTTRISEPIRREIEIDGVPYTVVLSVRGLKLVRKRFRTGKVLTWRRLLQLGDDEAEGGREPASAE